MINATNTKRIEARKSLEAYINRCEHEVTSRMNLAAVVPTVLLKNAPAVGMKAFAIMDTENLNDIVTDVQLDALKALLVELK